VSLLRKGSDRSAADSAGLLSLVVPRTIRLEPLATGRELEIESAISSSSRDLSDRLGLAGERLLGSWLSRYVELDPRRVLCWDTVLQANNVAELDAVVSAGLVFLEFKWSVRPERMFSGCTRQLRTAMDIWKLGCEPQSRPVRGIGVIVDCGPLVGNVRYQDTKDTSELVRMIKEGAEPFALCVLAYDEVAEYIADSPYASLLSPQGVFDALSAGGQVKGNL
jgi:hypothetical protein